MIALTLRRFIAVLALNFTFVAVALGQVARDTAWASAEWNIAAKQKLYVVTIAHPTRRHTCVVRYIDDVEIACVHAGRTTVFKARDVAALIEPGEHSHWYLYGVGFLAAAGAATWGTVVLAPICPPCAVATGVAALFMYVLTPGSAFLSDGDSTDSLLYLAPGQKLQVRLS